MNTRPRTRGVLDRRDVESIRAAVQQGQPVRRALGGGGRLHIERPLPYLCVYRSSPNGEDPGTRRFVTSEASFAVLPQEALRSRNVHTLLRDLAADAVERFGAFVFVELWAARDDDVAQKTHDISPQPGFRIFAPRGDELSSTVEALEQGLRGVRVLKRGAWVETTRGRAVAPPGLRPLFPTADLRRLGCDVLGIEVQPVYRGASGDLFPIVMRSLRRLVSIALRSGLHEYATTKTSAPPRTYRSLGRRVLARSVWSVDEKLAEVAGSFDLLLDVTPVNLDRAWNEFRRHRFEKAPRFFYRPLPVDPLVVKRRLLAVPVERIEEPTLARLFRESQLHLDRQLTMLLDRGTPRFVLGSLQVHGRPSESLIVVARDLVDQLPARSRDADGRGHVDAEAFATQARKEVAWYRRQDPDFGCRVEVRKDFYAGFMVSRGNLIIGRQARVAESRVAPLLHHEIGTHALTYHNGRGQAFRQFATGLPGYEALQEGLAVAAEYLCGGLSRARLRLLGGRVLAVQMLLDGATFVDTFRTLHRAHGFSQRSAYTMTARVFRAGGLVKDAVYLRGLLELLDYLANGGDLALLLAGKVAAHHVPMIEDLGLRGVLKAPRSLPRYFEDADARGRLGRLRGGATVLDLLEGAR